jgi:hypothetical protein
MCGANNFRQTKMYKHQKHDLCKTSADATAKPSAVFPNNGNTNDGSGELQRFSRIATQISGKPPFKRIRETRLGAQLPKLAIVEFTTASQAAECESVAGAISLSTAPAVKLKASI